MLELSLTLRVFRLWAMWERKYGELQVNNYLTTPCDMGYQNPLVTEN